MSVPFTYALQRDVIVATGNDTRSFLHSQLSNDIAGLAVGATTHAFALEPTGKIAALLRVHCVADDHFVLDTDVGQGASAIARLSKFKIRVKCEFVATTQTVAALRGLTAELRSELLTKPGVVPAWLHSITPMPSMPRCDKAATTTTTPSVCDVRGQSLVLTLTPLRCLRRLGWLMWPCRSPKVVTRAKSSSSAWIVAAAPRHTY
jgi:folate-binding Fe-S cluster repair protein YgfZ